MGRHLTPASRAAAVELQRPMTPAEKPCRACGARPSAPPDNRATLSERITAKLERLAPHIARDGRPVTIDDLLPRCAACGRRRARGVTR